MRVYFELASVIVTLVLLAQMLGLLARSQTSNDLKALLGVAPKTARVVREDGREEDVPLDRIMVDDWLPVRPGEKVPVDGVCSKGPVVSMNRWSPARLFQRTERPVRELFAAPLTIPAPSSSAPSG